MIRLLFITLLCTPLLLSGQDVPPFRQFHVSPVLYNSAYTGLSENANISMLYRSQWSGFDDAPTTSGFNFQSHARNKVSLTFQFLSHEAVLLRQNSLNVSFCYKVRLASHRSIFFSLGGGVVHHELDISRGDYANDPAILNAAATDFSPLANFGMLYRQRGFLFGLALPRLLGQNYFNPASFGGNKYSLLLNQLISVSQTINLHDKKYFLKPYALYRLNRDLNNYWEAGSLIDYQRTLWCGSSYRQHQGMAFFLGGRIKKLMFNYTYELPSSVSRVVSTSAHEFTLNLSLAKKAQAESVQQEMPAGFRY